MKATFSVIFLPLCAQAPLKDTILRYRWSELLADQFRFPHEVGDRSGLHFAHDIAPVQFHGDFADTEFVSDLFVHQAADNGPHDLALPWRQLLGKGTDGLVLGAFAASRRVPLHRLRDGIQNVLFLERLGQKIDGSRFHCSHAHRNITEAGHENDRHPVTHAFQLHLEIKTARAREPHVQQQAAVPVQIGFFQESGGAVESFDVEFHGAEKIGKGFPHRHVVIDDEDDG
ncbi:Hypothetical protein AT6N2_L2253 [Agrobacterium tumefaciens]|nr:Hypothetical protein AT6N2_L2253 [Agrobacterium tumefaciens]